jgi:hypothetical protein
MFSKIKNSLLVGLGLVLFVLLSWFFFSNKQSKQAKKPNGFSELFVDCGETECGKVSFCEGKTISLSGYLDLNNISTEKFLIQEFFGNLAKANSNVEVHISGDKNTKENIFRKINDLAKNPEKPITVTGVVAGFDMPIMGACRRGFVLNLFDESNLSE